jgi:transposase-like protein
MTTGEVVYAVRSDWTCAKCGQQWTNELILEGQATEEMDSQATSAVCPGCGRGYALMYKKGQTIKEIKTAPRGPVKNRQAN